MLRACITDFKGSWDRHLPLVEFAYNNIFHTFVSMFPYEVLYDRSCMSPIGWFEVGGDFIYKTFEKVHIIRNRF